MKIMITQPTFFPWLGYFDMISQSDKLIILDDVNFEGGNPFGSQDFTAEISNETFLIGQKTAENKVYVEFELTSPLDLENFEITNRRILAKYCYWTYRGCGCNYFGPPIEKEDGYNFTDIDGQEVTPSVSPYGFMDNSNNLWNSTTSYNKGDIKMNT
jgi:lambda family phage minor tail protein L